MPDRRIRFAGTLRCEFRLNRPDVVLRDSSERGSAVIAKEMQIPLITVPDRADYFTPGDAILDDETFAPHGMSRADDTADGNVVLAMGPSEMYEVDVTTGRSFLRFGPAEDREKSRAAVSTEQKARAVFSFGTFACEPDLNAFISLSTGLRDAGVSEFLFKVRDRKLRRVVSRDTIFIGHGSLLASMEALYAGSSLLVIPSLRFAVGSPSNCAIHRRRSSGDSARGGRLDRAATRVTSRIGFVGIAPWRTARPQDTRHDRSRQLRRGGP